MNRLRESEDAIAVMDGSASAEQLTTEGNGHMDIRGRSSGIASRREDMISSERDESLSETDVGEPNRSKQDIRKIQFHTTLGNEGVCETSSIKSLEYLEGNLVSSSAGSELNGRSSVTGKPPLNYQSKYTPEQTARMLYEGTLPGYDETNVIRILGVPDEYHTSVLNSYVRHYDFLMVRIDNCLRMVSKRVHLVGEAQAVDRIIRVIADRYWSCNTVYHGIFISKDIVYCCLFSLILLNTDLNVLGVLKPGNFTKMRKSTYIKNTFGRLAELYTEFHTENNVEINLSLQKQWKANFETLLSSCYDDVKKDPYAINPRYNKHNKVQHLSDASPHKEGDEETRSVEYASGTSSPKGSRCSVAQSHKSIAIQSLTNVDPSSSSIKSNGFPDFEIALSLYNTITVSGKYAAVFQKTPELLHPNIRSLITIDQELPNLNKSSSDISKSSPPGESLKHFSRPSKDNAHVGSKTQDSSDNITVAISGRVSFKDIGKKDRDKSDLSQTLRFEYWAAIVYDDQSFLDLALWKFTAISECRRLVNSRQRARLFGRKDGRNEYKQPICNFENSNFEQNSCSDTQQYPIPISKKYSKKLAHKCVHLSDSWSTGSRIQNMDKSSKLIFGVPKVCSLLHSVAHMLPGFDHNNDSGFYSMRLRLYNGNNCILSSPSKEFITKFKDTVNVHASCKSREPMANLEGNVEYGWDVVARNRNSCACYSINNDSNISSNSSADISNKRTSCDSLYIPGYNTDITGYLSRASNSQTPVSIIHTAESINSSFADTPEATPEIGSINLKTGSKNSSTSPWNLSDGDSGMTISLKQHNPIKKMFRKRNFASSKLKIHVWHSIPPPTDRLSHNPPEKQLDGFKRRLVYIEDSLFEHSAHRAPMEEYYKNRDSVGELALSNWIYKQNYLINEFEKYKVYVQTLTQILLKDDDSKTTH